MSESRPPASPPPDALAEDTTVVRTPGSPAQPSAPSASSREPSPTAVAPGHTLAGRYTVLDMLGQGGMGMVLAAYDSRLDRRVALKLLRARSRVSDGPARMVREAQAMARLSHPHVVAVYDSGTLEDGSVFLAMEYVQGRTLRQWVEQQPPRPWREVLGAYLAAGRGLAAAHAAGLIHRDFKPDNVLVGEDGRVRVTDFGLARVDSPADAPTSTQASLPSGALGTPLTQEGTVLGTPAYMAPELLESAPADVRTDVYAFCASLYEALGGCRPFDADSFSELILAQRAGRLSPLPSSVPSWLALALRQGLHPQPSQRPASMEALLALLEADPEVKRRSRLRAVALALPLVGAVGLLAWNQVRQPGCEALTQRMDGVWDAPLKARVRQALVDTGLPQAPATAERVEAVLEDYAQSWVRQRVQVCEASGQSQPGPPQNLALLQEACLERRRSQLHALTGLLARGPDASLIHTAVQAAQALPPLAYCADARALTAAVPPPEDPAVRTRVEALQPQVDRLEALDAAGKYAEGLTLAGQVLPQVEAVGHAPLHARALYLQARLQEGTGDYPGAEKTVRQAIALGAQGRDAVQVSLGWTYLLNLVGVRQARLEEAQVLLPVVEAAAALAEDDATHAAALNILGNVLNAGLGRYEEAQEKHTQALALRQKVLGPEHPLVASSLNNLAIVLGELGRFQEARESYVQALAIQQKVLGPEHPEVSPTLHSLGEVLLQLGRPEEAQAQYTRALAIDQEVLGPEHPDLAFSLIGLGQCQARRGPLRQAQASFQRALALQEKAFGPEHPDIASTLLAWGEAVVEQQRQPRQALPLFERALRLAPPHLRPEVQFRLAQALWQAGQERPRALALATEAHQEWQRRGASHHLTESTQWLASHPLP